MLCRVLIARMDCLSKDILALYTFAQDAALPVTARLAAAGCLASFLSSTTQPLEKWLLDTLTLRMGLCLVTTALGLSSGELADDVRLIKRSLSNQAVRRVEGILGRLTSSEFAGGGMAVVINDHAMLGRLYDQALAKAAFAPSNVECDEAVTRARLEGLLVALA